MTPIIIGPTVDEATTNDLPTINGIAEPGSTVIVTNNGEFVCSAIADVNGHWSCTPLNPFTGGDQTLSVIAIDPAGNISQPSIRPFVIFFLAENPIGPLKIFLPFINNALQP